jgi:nuclear pore complex protein Nup107
MQPVLKNWLMDVTDGKEPRWLSS